MMIVNGKEVESVSKTIGEYLKDNGYDARTIAIELNGEILPKENYDTTVLSDNDKMEIVCFMGGGK